MSMMPRSALLVLTLAVALTAPALAQAAPTTIDSTLRGTPVDAAHGAVVWSRYDAQLNAYRLVVRQGDVNTVPAVAPSPIPFDADLGTTAGGKVAVVYSRCASYAHFRAAGDNCDLFVLDLASGGERAITAANSRATEFNPTLSRGTLAWVREARAGHPLVYRRALEPLTSTKRSKRAPGLPSRRCVHGKGKCLRVKSGRIDELELSGKRLAIAMTYFNWIDLRVGDVRKRSSRVIATEGVGLDYTLAEYLGLSFAKGRLAWWQVCKEQTECSASGAYRYRFSNTRYDFDNDFEQLDGWAWTGSATYRAQAASILSDVDDCRAPKAPNPVACLVVRAGQPEWKHVATRNVLADSTF
jgi:hypothetical protein